jgi:putative DNA primase/helicase
VKVATADYAREQDTVAQFLEERCWLGGGGQVLLRVAYLRSAYEAFCGEIGATPVSAKAFGTALRRAGVETKRTTAARFYVGISLLNADKETMTRG